jgi:hypothetical protein
MTMIPTNLPESFPRAFGYVCTVKRPTVDDFKLMALIAHSGECMYAALADLAPDAADAALLRENAREQLVQADRMRRAVELLTSEAESLPAGPENPYYRVPEGGFEAATLRSVARAEEKNERNYLRWAEAVGREDVAELCRRNAAQEADHRARLVTITPPLAGG